MEQIAFYLLKSAAWLAGFTLVYLLFLQKERFFMLKRIYLLAGVALSLILPLVTLHYRVELPAPLIQETQGMTPVLPSSPAAAAEIVAEKDPLKWFMIFYAAGLVFLLGRTLQYLFTVYRAVRSGPVHREGDALLVRSEKYTSAFSFFNYVFINPSLSGREVREILNHEMVHLRQKHWFDLLLVEVISLVQWMNPFAWICSALVRQNHEHLADEVALQQTSDPAGYRATLLNQVFSARLISLSNSFNFSFNTNRFEMMKKKTYSPFRKLKLLLVLPLMAGMLFAFASPRYVYAETTGTSELTISQPAPLIQNTVRGVVYREDGTPFPGVNVNVSGTSLSVSTDASGRFEFRGIPENVILVFTYKGYKYLPLNPVTDKEMIVRMQPDPNYVDPATVKPDATDKPKPKQLLVVDGVITDQTLTEIMEKMGNDLGIAKALTFSEAKEKYGEKGAAGVMEIYSREKAKELGMTVPLRRKSQDDFPTFGGSFHTTFTDWVISRTKYPPEAAAAGIEGWAHVSFTVEPDGSVSNIKPKGTTNPLLANALAEVIKTSPLWEPPKNPGMNEPFTSEITAKFSLPDKVGGGEIFVVVEKMPVYPGGDEALFKFINENVRYPPEAKERGIQGKVILRFVVTSDGSVEDVTVVRGIDPLLDAEAVRVMSLLPDWTPGMQGGKPVNVWYSVPISFALSSGEKIQEGL
jgi:TonB family protein